MNARRGKVWLRVFPDKSFTKKPLETRMGHGKAGVEGAEERARGGGEIKG